MSLRHILAAAAISASTLTAHAQDGLLMRFGQYRNQVSQEKMFLHTDRQVYLAGETMWLKIYTVDAALHKPTDVSRVAYVEIVDKDNQALTREKIELKDGVGTGSIFIPASIASGNYLLRAYTSWMKNFEADYFFRKPVTIVNSFVKLEKPVASAAPANDIQLFPEGGNLLANVSNKVGIKVTKPDGHGADFRAALVDDSNDTLVRFNPLRFGMGSFEFIPVTGKKYRAVVRVPGSPVALVPLPEIHDEGFAMKVKDNGDVLDVEVSFQPPIQNGPAVYLLAHTSQQLAKVERKNISKGKAYFQVRKDQLKGGVSHITVFDEKVTPVAERLYFKAPAQQLNIAVKSSQSQYKTRAQVTLEVQTDGAIPQMSMSVYRMDSIAPALYEQHINDYLFLTSDLRGSIESPGYYLSTAPEAAAAADNLMLTQGWRRFTWSEVVKDKQSFTYAPEVHGHLVQGIVKDLDGNPAGGVIVYVSVPGNLIDVYSGRSDAKGEVLFEMKRLIGGQKILTYTDSLHKVELVDPFSSAKTNTTIPALTISPSIETQLLARTVAMQVQNLYFEDKYVTPRFDSTAFYGKADETYLLDDYVRFPVMEEVLREYVRGVLVRKQRDNFRFFNLDMVNKKPFNETPLILIDGVPVFDVNKVMEYDPLKVKKVEVMTRRFYHGYAAFPGIISYTTYKGDLDGFELDKRYVDVDYEGLQLQREFYSPRHESLKEGDTRLPDQRSLLYWNADLSTDATGKQYPQFFTSDVPGTYQIVIEAMTADGKSGFTVQTFNVTR